MISKSEKLKLCMGCRENFYNGNNPYGISECWHLESAEPVKKKFVHINDVPPWKHQRVEKTLNCHRRSKFIAVEPNRKY